MKVFVLHIIILIIVSVYALLNLIIGLIHINKLYIPKLNASLFIVGSICLAMIYTKISYGIYFIVAGHAIIQIGALLNGLHIRGKIKLKHQVTRLLFGITVIELYYYYY